MEINLNGKTSLVCASSRGIGYSCAKNLAVAGSNIILTGRNENTLNEAKANILEIAHVHSKKITVSSIKVDLDKKDELHSLIDSLDSYDGIDILILNSGGPAPGKFDDFETIDDFEEKSSMITFPASSLIKKVLPVMKKRKWGRIINISSIGLAKPITGLAVSNAARGHLGALMVGIANENACHGITLNTVLPGIIWTDRQKYLTESDAASLGIGFEEMKDRKSSSIPSGVMGDPDDVGHLVTFLSSDYASYINSQFISVDGGLLGLLR